MIKKYRKKPIDVEVLQWTGDNHREMYDFIEPGHENDYMKAIGNNFYIDHTKISGGLIIKTLDGDLGVNIGDYIIKEHSSKFYPVSEKKLKLLFEKK